MERGHFGQRDVIKMAAEMRSSYRGGRGSQITDHRSQIFDIDYRGFSRVDVSSQAREASEGNNAHCKLQSIN
jgi:hypothetical protein